jgi:hypothetical protein
MKVQINNYTSSQFAKVIGKSNLFFDTKNGLLYYKENNKLQELPDQKRNLVKLNRLLEDYWSISDIALSQKEQDIIKQMGKQIRTTQKRKDKLNKTKKNFFSWLN